MIMVSSVGWRRARYREAGVAVVVTAASGYDLGYVENTQAGPAEPERTAGGYHIKAAGSAVSEPAGQRGFRSA
jgi:hypothetical protein